MSDEEFHEILSDDDGDLSISTSNSQTSTTNKSTKQISIQPPEIQKQTTGARTIFVTTQFRSFEDDYVRVRSIGEPGQFGTAFECYMKNDPQKTRRCVKEINKSRFHHISVDARNEILQAMQNEITTLKQVDHPNIVKLFDVYEDRHFLHLVMEFLSGGELFQRIVENDAFSEKEAAKILKQILEALDHMHSIQMLHLDLKPDNILFSDESDDAVIKLIDFGMARVVPRLAKLKDRVGTPNYMAPEVIKGHYSKGADVWSLGVILFCMLFGFPPFYPDDDHIHLDEFAQLEQKIKLGFNPIVKPGFGPWFPESIPVSENCRRLLSKMLTMDVKKRWTVKECIDSQWVRGICSSDTIPAIVRDALKKFHGTSKFKVAVANIFAFQMDAEHVHSVTDFFNRLDGNKDGKLSLKEFKNGMKTEFKTDLSDEQLDAVFATLDLDDDREVTLKELITITTHRMLVDEDERLFQAFNDLDENGDGQISKDELNTAMKRIHRKTSSMFGGNNMLNRMETAFACADINGDGNIDYEEFLRILHPDFTADMDLHSFQNPKKEHERVRAPRYDVDITAQKADYYLIPLRNLEPATDIVQSASGLFAIDEMKDSDSAHKLAVSKLTKRANELEAQNELLVKKLSIAEQKRNDVRSQYENVLFTKLESQTNALSNLRQQWQQQHNSQTTKLLETIQLKDEQIHSKDMLIAQLNQFAHEKNEQMQQLREQWKQIELKFEEQLSQKDVQIQKLNDTLQQAVESKMQSLRLSHQEIANLKQMLLNREAKNGKTINSSASGSVRF